LLRLIWRLFLAQGLFRVSQLFQKHTVNDSFTNATNARDTTLLKVLSIMGNVWRISAWIIGLGSIVDVAVAFQRNRPWRMTVACAVTMLGWRWYSIYTTKNLQLNNDPIRKSALRTAQFMSVCIGTLWIRFLVSIALIVPSAPILKRLLMLTHVQTPWITACLLYNLRRSFLSNLVSSSPTSSSSTIKADQETRIPLSNDLLQAQVKFYKHVAHTFKAEIVARVLVVLLTLLRGFRH
jgi:hypothetical protein